MYFKPQTVSHTWAFVNVRVVLPMVSLTPPFVYKRPFLFVESIPSGIFVIYNILFAILITPTRSDSVLVGSNSANVNAHIYLFRRIT